MSYGNKRSCYGTLSQLMRLGPARSRFELLSCVVHVNACLDMIERSELDQIDLWVLR